MGSWWKVASQAARDNSYLQLAVHLYIIHDRICGTGGGVVFVTDYSACLGGGSRQTSLVLDPLCSVHTCNHMSTGSLES
jgi:hypothetical protein